MAPARPAKRSAIPSGVDELFAWSSAGPRLVAPGFSPWKLRDSYRQYSPCYLSSLECRRLDDDLRTGARCHNDINQPHSPGASETLWTRITEVESIVGHWSVRLPF